MSDPTMRDEGRDAALLEVVRPDERIAVPVAPDGLVRGADYAAYRDAEEVLALARERAAAIEAEARAAFEAEKLRGHREGLEAGRAEIFALVAAYQEGLEAAVAERVEELLALVGACVEQAIGAPPPRDFVGGLVEQALRRFRDASRVEVYGHPETIGELERAAAGAGTDGRPGVALRAHADPELPTDEFRLVTGELSISYSRTQLLGLITAALAPAGAETGAEPAGGADHG